MDDQEPYGNGEAWQCHTSGKPIWPEEPVASEHKPVTCADGPCGVDFLLIDMTEQLQWFNK